MALRLIDPGKDARLYCYAHHNLARSFCYLGHYAAAAEALAAGRDFYGKHPDPLHPIPRYLARRAHRRRARAPR